MAPEGSLGLDSYKCPEMTPMNPKTKTALWVLSLLTIIYISNQYREIQRLRIPQQIQRAAEPKPSFHITNVNGQTMRINDTTGETYYWAVDGGGWVKINETNLVTAISDEERNARKAVIQTWYNTLEPGSDRVSYEIFESSWRETPSWQIQESFDKWKHEQVEKKQRAAQESWKLIIQFWYKELTPQEQAAIPYEQFEANLLAVTDHLAARQKVIDEWYDLMDDVYKQTVSLKRFEAIEIQQSSASLQAALAEQQKAVSTSKLHSTDTVFCPVGGEHYSGNVRICPKHNVATRVLTKN